MTVSPPESSPAARRWRTPATVSVLAPRNYRLWFSGQTLPMLGFWMWNVAQGWLVYDMTGSGPALDTISYIDAISSLFLMIRAGALCSRMSGRTRLVTMQAVTVAMAL